MRTMPNSEQKNQSTKFQGNVNPVPFSDEIDHLREISQKLDDALKEASTDVNRLDGEYMVFKRYMVENRSEIDPHEMFQNEQTLARMDHSGAFAVGIRDKIAKMKDSPYFSRIDFQETGAAESKAYYIGRFSFNYANQFLIFDWRAPIASIFYDYELGPAGFEAPQGRIEGVLTRKRQLKIQNGKLEYAFDSSVNIQDDILQLELSHTSDEKMKSIIATIQKEQNQIVRNEKAGTLIVQGVAGSGKTSIALHRIAYLLYRYSKRLLARNVVILSPNRVFGDYIANVLPELGEEPICEMSFADVAKVQLEGIVSFEIDKDPAESNDSEWSKRVRFKSTLDFVRLLDSFIVQMPDMVFCSDDYTFGRFVVQAETIRARFHIYDNYPVRQRLQMIADDILSRFETDNFMEEDLPKNRAVRKALDNMLKVKTALSLYRKFYAYIGKPEMFVLSASKTLEWADVFPFLYLYAAFEGLKKSDATRHLLIDEMQDYSPIQYAVINLLFPCPKTILGDFQQSINPNHLHTLDDIRQIYADGEFVELQKSYRSTNEIISFAERIAGTGTIDAVGRHGDPPAQIACRNRNDELLQIRHEIEAFLASAYSSLGIITKTNRDAKLLHDELLRSYNVHLISTESTRFVNGISILSIPMSKGLEFDAVILPFADKATYFTQYDRSLLYVACTRAMHRLTLLHSGEASPYLRSVDA